MKKEKEQNLVKLQGRLQRGIIQKEPSRNHKLTRAWRACWCIPSSHTTSNWDVSVGQRDTVTLGMWLMRVTHQWGSADSTADLTISTDRLDLPTPNGCKTTRCSVGLLWQRQSIIFSTGNDHQKIKWQWGKMCASSQDRTWNSVVQIVVLYSLLVYAVWDKIILSCFPQPKIFSTYEREQLNGEYHVSSCPREVLGSLYFLLVKKHQLF